MAFEKSRGYRFNPCMTDRVLRCCLDCADKTADRDQSTTERDLSEVKKGIKREIKRKNVESTKEGFTY